MLHLASQTFRVVTIAFGALFSWEAGATRFAPPADRAILLTAGCALLMIGYFWKRIFNESR